MQTAVDTYIYIYIYTLFNIKRMRKCCRVCGSNRFCEPACVDFTTKDDIT